MTVQSLWTTSDWNCMGTRQTIATSKGIAGLILDVDRDENSDYDEDDREFLKTLFKPFSGICGKGTGGNVSDWRLKTECITATIHFCIQ